MVSVHYNQILTNVMKEWYTAESVRSLAAEREAGHQRLQLRHMSRGSLIGALSGRGRRSHLVAQATTDRSGRAVERRQPMAAWVQGERTDDAYRAGKLDSIESIAKKLRDLGVTMVGSGATSPKC